MKTIFAQGTAKGKAGVSIMRISGPDSLKALKHLTGKNEFETSKLHYANLSYKGKLIDQAMVVYFKAPHSFTGEDVVELHTHGSISVMRLLSDSLFDFGLSLAQPGEFSKRAFLNGKMDLTSAEGLADLIDAETEMQHQQAMRHMSGELEKLCEEWRQNLLKSQGLIEAYIDFPDESIPEEVLTRTQNMIDELISSLKEKLADNRRGERLRHGITMTVIGEPNVGKSSLMNFLSKRDISIISDIPGTTRDVLETHLDIGGYPIILSDTAGLRSQTSDIIEQEGIKRAIKAAKDADIKIIMIDATKINSTDKSIWDLVDDRSIVVVNKMDLPNAPKNPAKNPALKINNAKQINISLKEKDGLDNLINNIIAAAEEILGNKNSSICITRERHRQHIAQAIEALERCDIQGDLVLAAENLRIGARDLSLMTGKIEVEEILGEIFSNFCIGK